MKTVQMLIRGRVQGVGYRAWALAQARRLGVDGWVRNRHDGRVEALISGATDNVDEMISACHQGPQAAEVEHIEITAATPPPKAGFEQHPTA